MDVRKLAAVLVVAVLLLGAIQLEIAVHEVAHAVVALVTTGVPPHQVLIHPFAGIVINPTARHGDPWSVAAGPAIDFVLAFTLLGLAWGLPRKRGLLLVLSSGAIAALGRLVLPLGFSDLYHLARIWGVPDLRWAAGWLFPVVAVGWLALGVFGGRRFLEEIDLARGRAATRAAIGATALALAVGVPLGVLDPLVTTGTRLAPVGKLVLPAWLAFLGISSIAALAARPGARRWLLAWCLGLVVVSLVTAIAMPMHTPGDRKALEAATTKAEALERAGNWEAAASAWRDAYQVSPQARFALLEARALSQVKRWDGVVEASRRAVSAACDDGVEAAARTWWAQALRELGHKEDACRQLQIAARLFPVEPSPELTFTLDPWKLVSSVPGCELPPPPTPRKHPGNE